MQPTAGPAYCFTLLYENIILLFQSRSCQPRLIFFSLDDTIVIGVSSLAGG